MDTTTNNTRMEKLFLNKEELKELLFLIKSVPLEDAELTKMVMYYIKRIEKILYE